MVDKLTEREVTFSKIAAGQGKELEGAKITVSGKDINGAVFTETWTSGGNAKVLKLKAGEYKMVEDQAPLGYNKASEIVFRVNLDGSVQIKQDGKWVNASEAKVQMVDKLTEREVTFSKIAAGQGKELEGAKITVSGKDVNGAVFTETWTSGGSAKVLKLKAGEYKMVEDQAPLGYNKASEIVFRVNLDGSVQIKQDDKWVEAKDAKIQMVDKLKTVEVEGSKTWNDNNDQDGKRPTEIKINLMKKVGDGEVVKVETKTVKVDGQGNWTWSWKNLPEYENGKKITYSITEEAVDGYTTQVDGYNVTNSHAPEKIVIEGSKTWNDKGDQDGKRPAEITINLLKNGTKINSVKVKEADGWKWKFENLDKYENGNEITYTITEEKVEGYTTEVNGYNVKNSYTPGKTSIQVTKAWEDKGDQDGKRPASVTIKLLADGKETGKTLTLTKADNWTGTFTDLDEYKAGKKIKYTIKEESVGNGYVSAITGSAAEGYKVTNTREPEKVEVEGSKTWNDKGDQDGKRPAEITINLLKNGTKINSVKVKEADGWKWKFENLDKYEKGNEITYTITEEKVEGYTTEVNGYNVKNSYTPGKTSIQVTKAWEDKHDQDGKRPASVTIKLLADGKEVEGKTLTLSKANNWTGSFTDLDEYKAGKKIEYTIKEEAVGNGYTSVITGSAKDGFVVTNIREPKVPKTGDGTNVPLYAFMLLLSGSVLTLVGYKRRRNMK